MLRPRCPHCDQPLAVESFGEELKTLYEKARGKEFTILKELIRVRGKWVKTARLMQISKSSNATRFCGLILQIRNHLLGELYLIENHWWNGYRLVKVELDNE